MKAVSIVEVCTTKFSQSLFLQKILGNLMSFEKKCIAMNPENHRVNNVYFKFCFFIYTSNRLVKTCIFLVCFCYLLNSFMKEHERQRNPGLPKQGI